MSLSNWVLRFRLIWQHCTGKFRKRKFKPLHTLDEQAMQQVQQEAAMLRSRYGVEVRALAPDEKPDIPQRVDRPG